MKYLNPVTKKWIDLPTEKGDPGFSPEIRVKENTDSKYILTIENEDGTFDTPNLKSVTGGASSWVDVDDKPFTSFNDSNFNISPTGEVEISLETEDLDFTNF